MVKARGANIAGARLLAVALYDLAWLLPRTVGRAAALSHPMPASELEVMRLLARRPGLSVNEVARELGIRPSNVSTAVRALVSRGILQRVADVSDARVVRLEPTAAALTDRDIREQTWGQSLVSMMADLSPTERQQLLDAAPTLAKLAQRLALSETLAR